MTTLRLMEISEFLRSIYIPEHSLAAETQRQLILSIKLFIEFAGEVQIGDLSHEILNRWIATNPRQWSAKTLKNRVADVLCLWNYAYAIQLVEHAPCRRRVRRVPWIRRRPDAWTIEQLQAIVSSAQNRREFLSTGIRVGDLVTGCVYVGFYSALRPDDLRRLMRYQLSSRGEWIPQRKKHGAEVLVIMPDWVLSWISARWPDDEPRLFAWPKCIESFYLLWKSILKDAGLPSTKTDGLQKLRRTAITYGEAARAGYGAMMAGHSPGSRTTYAHYVDLRIAGAFCANLLPDIRPN